MKDLTSSNSRVLNSKLSGLEWKAILRLFVAFFCLLSTNFGTDAIVCYRKYHDGKGMCKSSVNKPVEDAKACCSRYGQGYATEMKHHGNEGKWFECTPCNVEGEHTAWPKQKSKSRSGSKHSSHQHKTSKVNPKSNFILTPDVVDDDWSPWSEWGPCSAACDWSPWSEWSPCSAACGKGVHQRTRFCLKDKCTGEDFQERSCPNLKPCAVDGGWTDWLPWEPCSVKCGNGSQIRLRTCTNPAPLHGGKDCDGANIERQVCNLAPCPVDGGWNNWKEWGPCNVSCGEGWQERRRSCDKPRPSGGGKACEGSGVEVRLCENVCAVDGVWSDWSNWTDCSVTCGDGFKSRSRRCDSPAPKYGGKPCEGLELESSPCTGRTHCSVNGNWSEWSKIDGCSALPCSGQAGFRTRFRSCTNPRPMFGGKSCQGRSWKREICFNNEFCTEKVNGGWCDWTDWSGCLGGIIRRERLCQCPPPANGGSKCYGVEVEEKVCFRAEMLGNKLPVHSSSTRSTIGTGCHQSDTEVGSGDGDTNCDEESDMKNKNKNLPDDENDDEDDTDAGSGIKN